MKEYSTFIGMDVHKNSIDIAIADEGRNGQLRHYGKIDGILCALDKVVWKLVSKGVAQVAKGIEKLLLFVIIVANHKNSMQPIEL